MEITVFTRNEEVGPRELVITPMPTVELPNLPTRNPQDVKQTISKWASSIVPIDNSHPLETQLPWLKALREATQAGLLEASNDGDLKRQIALRSLYKHMINYAERSHSS